MTSNDVLLADLSNIGQVNRQSLTISSVNSRVVPETFGVDNTGAIVAGVVDEKKGEGFIYRLAFQESTQYFANSATYLPIANRVLTDGTPIILQRGEKTFVGVSRPAMNEIASVSLLESTSSPRIKAPISPNARIATGGRFIGDVDVVTNAVLLFDVQKGDSIAIHVDRELDGQGLTPMQKASLTPKIVAGRTEHELLVMWAERATRNIVFVSRYIGFEKSDQGTFKLNLDPVLAQSIQTAAEKLSITEPLDIGFRLVGGPSNSEDEGADGLLLALSSRLSAGSYRTALDALDDATKAPVQRPAYSLLRWPPEPVSAVARPTGRVVAISQGFGMTMVHDGGSLYMYMADGAEQNVSLVPATDQRILSDVVLVPNWTGVSENLIGSTLVYIETAGSDVSVRFARVQEDGTLVHCAPCTGRVGAAAVLNLFGSWSALAGMVSADGRWIASFVGDKTLLYEFGSAESVMDELPLSLPVAMGVDRRHLVLTPDRRSSSFRSLLPQ
jgi:hypothetical protein